jgi:peroxiredoxin
LAQLRQDYDKFKEQETEIVVIGPEDANAFSTYWENRNLPFIGLPDPTHTVLKLYWQEVNLFKFGRLPAQIMIDKQGLARFVHYGNNMGDIPANEEILKLLQTVNEEKHVNH